MTTILEPEAVEATDDVADVEHYWCCDPKVAWCGAPIDNDPDEPFDESIDPDDCPMCKSVKRQEFRAAGTHRPDCYEGA